MGGNAFKDSYGEQLASSIDLKYIGPTLEDFLSNHLIPAGINGYVKIGSTGKKQTSGDLDIAVDIGAKSIQQFKNDLLSSLNKTLQAGDAKKLGQNLAVLYPIAGINDEYVQIDIMLVKNANDAGWLMSGTGAGVRGAWRNSLLSYVAKITSDSMPARERITIAFPGGLQKKFMPEPYDPSDRKNKGKWVPMNNRTTDPQEIIDALNIDAKPEDIGRYEDLVDTLAQDKKLMPTLAGFKDYASNTSYSKKGQDDAFEYLDSVINKTSIQVEEHLLRKIIKDILY